MALIPEPDGDLKREACSNLAYASVREITRAEAEPLLMRYEWLQNLGSSRYFVGLWFRHPVTGVEYLSGVEAFGSTGGGNVAQSICGKKYAKQVITLVRGCCSHYCHKHSASWFIPRACKLISEKYHKHIVIAYADESAAEIGCCYSACNWLYVGPGGTDQVQYRADGRIIGSKSIATRAKSRVGRPDRKRGATIADVNAWADRMRAQGYTVKGRGYYQHVEKMTRAEARQQLVEEHGEFVRATPKHRYIYFVGDRRKVKELRKTLRLQIQPYPKRRSMTKLDDAVQLLLEEKQRIDAALIALGVSVQRAPVAKAPAKTPQATAPKKRGNLSPEGRAKIAAAARERWARMKAIKETKAPAKAKKAGKKAAKKAAAKEAAQ